MTPTTALARCTPSSSAPTFRLWNTCVISEVFLPAAFGSPRFLPEWPGSAAGRCGLSGMSYRQTKVSGHPAVALRSPELELVAVPAIGMKLTNLRRLNGREWLWRSDQIPLALPEPE